MLLTRVTPLAPWARRFGRASPSSPPERDLNPAGSSELARKSEYLEVDSSREAGTIHWGELTMGFDRITRDPNRLGGQPCIRDLRITVRRALQAMAIYPDRSDLRREYPELEDEDLRQALEFAAAQLEDRSIDLPAAS